MEILEIVFTTEGRVRTADLAARFDIGQNLLANDLKLLEDLGLIVRGHGWVMRRTTEIEDLFAGSDYAARKARNIPEKKAIAKYIASQLEDGTEVLLDAGSTALEVGMRLVEREKSIDVVTNSLPLLIHLARHSSLSCYFVGGDYSRDYAATVGFDAAKLIEGRKVDAAVLTPRALSLMDPVTAQATELPTGRAVQKAVAQLADRLKREPGEVAEQNLYFGVYAMDSAQYPYKSTLIKNATKLFVALDHTKFSTSGQCFFAIILTDLIRERRAPEPPPFAPVRTRGAVLLRRTIEREGAPDIDVEDPVDLRDPDSTRIVTTTEDGDLPPMELVRLLRLLKDRDTSRFEEKLIPLLREVLVIVNREGEPIPDTWLDRYVLS
jgi:DeoR/GlpR family transcriptional regulator of sugar metabolism